jgi:hypothetical protein
MPRGIPNAKDVPVHAPTKEVHTADLPVAQPPVIESIEDRGEVVIADASPDQKYLDLLKFNEDAVTIRIERGTEEFAPSSVQVWVNGEGAEVMNTAGKWAKVGWLPIGIPVVTKRKFVEVLARSRTDRVRASEDNTRPNAGEDGWKLHRTSTQSHAFSVLHDPAGAKGTDWLSRIYTER